MLTKNKSTKDKMYSDPDFDTLLQWIADNHDAVSYYTSSFLSDAQNVQVLTVICHSLEQEKQRLINGR